MRLEALTPILRTWDLPGSVAFYTHENDVTPGFTGSLYFRTDDADAVWQLLKDKTRICYPIENFDYGMREFAIYDNNGYVLQFGQPMPVLP